jgi:hypothetical protein
MTTVFVTFPVLRGSNRFFIQYGRRWSVVEHLLLYAAAENPASAAELAKKSGLPRRVILEAFIRLMRAGWVEMATEDGVIVFRATPLGAVHALYEQLPAATVEQQRWRSYHIEQITGGVFRRRELETRSLAHLPASSIWSDFAASVTVLGRRVERITKETGRTANMRLVLAPDHVNLTLEVRDRAKRRIFVLSHRLGIAARPVALLPMLSAVSANRVDARAFYGRTTGPLSGMAGVDLIREFAKEGVTIRPVHRPRLHAKVLGWDDDVLAISSLNWLSADPSERAPFSEIGVLVEAPKIAENFFRVFDNAHID